MSSKPIAKVENRPSDQLDSAALKAIYRQMMLMRHVEEQLTAASQSGDLRGSLHLATGQEALPAAACAALRPDDYLTCTYRGHGYVLAKGCDLTRVLAEILGRESGLGRGKGGKMHLTDLDHGLLGANGIVGGGVPTAVGAAMSAKIDGNGRLAMTVFGDGTINQGAVHEALNMAGLWKLPVIFLCENNLYAEMTPLSRSSAITQVSDRVAGYGIHALRIDGNDALAVYDAVWLSAERARKGQGPTFIEAMTYRTSGHYQADSESYRTKKEVAEWEAKSPILRFAKELTARKVCTAKELESLSADALAEVQAAYKAALASPELTVESWKEDVFA
ncbi:MAG: thiamine pyrophosphate-dependent dehydrogenase E1 component subunit alpha [Fimbriimonadaceae bacterium]|nr:thiamine pyrophosphate-dependent dehydrogenase E1 component subunit alpha [Fimbriimonadaceae bacterium]